MNKTSILLVLYPAADNYRFNRVMIKRHCMQLGFQATFFKFRYFVIIKITRPLGMALKTFRHHISFFESIVDGIYHKHQLHLFFNSAIASVHRDELIAFFDRHTKLIALRDWHA